jgi:hypothetical protein
MNRSVRKRPSKLAHIRQGDRRLRHLPLPGQQAANKLRHLFQMSADGVRFAGPVNNCVIYDDLRLELDEPGAPPAASAHTPLALFIAGDSTAADDRL